MKNKIGLGWRNIPRKVINERFDRIRTSYPYHIKEQYNPNEITMDNEITINGEKYIKKAEYDKMFRNVHHRGLN